MSSRPKKIIGWGIEVKGSDLNEAVVDEIFKKQASPSYKEFFDFTQENIDDSLHSQLRFEQRNIYESSEHEPLLSFVSIAPEDFENNEPFDEQKYFITFADNIIAPKELQQLTLKDYKDDSEVFLHHEMDLLNPKAYLEMRSFSKCLKRSPYLSQFTLVENKELFTAKDLKRCESSFSQDIISALSTREKSLLEIAVILTGSVNSDDLSSKYHLAPPADVYALSQFLNIFKDVNTASQLLPMLTYYWS